MNDFGICARDDFGICARDDEFARPAAESRRRFFIKLKISVENFRFKVGDFFEKMTLLAVAVRIGRRKTPFVMTGDKSQMIFVFIEQLNNNRFCGKFLQLSKRIFLSHRR